MEFKVIAGPPEETAVDALVVFCREGDPDLRGLALEADQALEGHLSRILSSGEIKGQYGQVLTIPTFGRLAAGRVVLVGLGKPEDFVLDRVRGALGIAGRALRSALMKSAAISLEDPVFADLPVPAVAQAAVEGILLGLYEFRKYKTVDPTIPGPSELRLVISAGEPAEIEAANLDEIHQAVSAGRCLAEATNMARDMVNEPANQMTPTRMCDVAMAVAQEWGLECTCLEVEEIEALGMGGVLGVAQGSNQPPRFIILHYRGGIEARGKPHPAFIGKGVTFDSGGISIKPSDKMDLMKGDMAGGAAVIAAMQAIGELKPAINVTGIIPAVENLPSGHAIRPGDILKAMNGKTMEVISTDAEGRMILADALSYARREGFSPLVDIATLTGAAAIALGPFFTGAFSNDRPLLDHLLEVAQDTGERIWPMPMDDDFKELIKSEVADVKNSGGREGGAITAALFLREFVEDTPWVHLDIAATAQTDETRPYQTKGGTGTAVRTLVGLALSLAEGRRNSK